MENFEQDLDTQSDWLNEQCTRYAFPGQVMAFVGNSEQLVPTQGMTKRELFAMAAMQGLVSNYLSLETMNGSKEAFVAGVETVAMMAVRQADALLRQLGGSE